MITSKTLTTRERLTTAALALFRENGYESTTVSQIAQNAGVSEMTFFRYFPTKESVLVDDPYDPVIGAAVAAQPLDLDPLTRVIRGIRAAWRGLPEPSSSEVRDRLRIVATSPGLRASMWRNSEATERVIVAALPGADTLSARVAAAAAMAALNTALLGWAAGDDTDLGQTIDAALDVLEPCRDQA